MKETKCLTKNIAHTSWSIFECISRYFGVPSAGNMSMTPFADVVHALSVNFWGVYRCTQLLENGAKFYVFLLSNCLYANFVIVDGNLLIYRPLRNRLQTPISMQHTEFIYDIWLQRIEPDTFYFRELGGLGLNFNINYLTNIRNQSYYQGDINKRYLNIVCT